MTASVKTFALIGNTFPSDKFEGLHNASIAARAARRHGRRNRVARTWSAMQDAVVMPKRLSA